MNESSDVAKIVEKEALNSLLPQQTYWFHSNSQIQSCYEKTNQFKGSCTPGECETRLSVASREIYDIFF